MKKQLWYPTQDLGCGWGSFGLYVLQHYPRCHVTCVSNSNTQRQYIESQGVKMGMSDRLQCITADANDFSTAKRFDRIVSIEMFEVFLFWLKVQMHMRFNYCKWMFIYIAGKFLKFMKNFTSMNLSCSEQDITSSSILMRKGQEGWLITMN